MTAQCHLTGGQFPSETGRLGSHGPRPFPQARASLPPTCARTTTPHSTPAPSGPGGPRGEQFSFGLGSQRPLPHPHAHTYPPKADFLLSRTLHLLHPHSQW